MTCRTAFKINIALILDEDIYQIIDLIGIEAGITDNYLYYGLIKKDTDDDFRLHIQVNESLSLLYEKEEILKSLLNMYNISYVFDVKFSNIEEELENNTSFIIDDKDISFLKRINCFYNLNDGYFEE